MKILLLALSFVSPILATEPSPSLETRSKWLLASQVTMGAAEAADIWTTHVALNRPNVYEKNSLGAMGSMAVGSAGILGAIIIERLIEKRHPKIAKICTILNLANAGQHANAAWRNVWLQ